MSERIIHYHTASVRLLIWGTYLLALVIDIFNLLTPHLVFLPPFTLLITLYWCALLFDRTFIPSAFILGLCLDALYQTTLGSHALIFTAIVFVMLRNRLHFRVFSVIQQAFLIMGYFIIYQILHFFIFSPVLTNEELKFYAAMPVIAGLIWTVLASVLNLVTQKQIHEN